jgi:cob(I)alamin adenosyltransferase
MLERGLVQIYTGDGRGKTTVALGQALRAAGQGNKVLIYQFLKPASLDIGERLALQSTQLSIVVESPDMPWDMAESFHDDEMINNARSEISITLKKIARYAKEKTYDLLILDEIIFCLSKRLAKLKDVMTIIKNRAPSVEIILTGRDATPDLIALADLVTEMKNIKHPLDKGQSARKGIEF